MSDKLNDLINTFYRLSVEVRDECIAYLMKTLEENGNKINWRDNDDIQEYVTVSYDGGNHPEYASNLFSTVYGIELLPTNDIVFDIEDCDEYDLTSVPTMELIDICSFIDSYQEELNLK